VALVASTIAIVAGLYAGINKFFLMQAGALNAVSKAEYRAEIDHMKEQNERRFQLIEDTLTNSIKETKSLRNDVSKIQGTMYTMVDMQREILRRL
jgi:aspartate/methionine/tyrosine aminotransferase